MTRLKFNESVRWALLKIKSQFPFAQVYVSLPLQCAKVHTVYGSTLVSDIRKMAERCGCIIIDSNLHIYSDEEINQISERSYKALVAFMDEFSDIAYPGFLKVAFDDIGLEHLQKIHDNWERVRGLLTVHYGELAPYECIDWKSAFKRR